MPLVEPRYFSAPEYDKTLGPEVADLCRLAGYGPDPEQQLVLDALFALDDYGMSAAFEVAVIAARQNLKTGVIKQATLGWLHITDQRLIVWSAHEFSTAQEAFRDLDELHAAHPSLARRVKKVHRANGDEAIELVTGARLKFRARTKAGGRGLSGDKVVLDEAFALRPDHMGALLPTLSAREDPQVVYGSSAGLADSEVLRRVRDRGRAGDSDRLVYAEWCADKAPCEAERCSHEPNVGGCQLDVVDNWRAANPALGRRISLEYIRAERDALPPLEFARERLGWWDEPPRPEDVFPAGKWSACDGRPVPEGAPIQGLAVAVSFDQTRAAIGAASSVDGVTYVKPLQSGPGTDWLVEAAADIQAAHDGIPVLVDGRGPASSKVKDLERGGVVVQVLSTDDVCEACAGLFDAVAEERLGHDSYPELQGALRVAVQRPVGDRWAWGRRQSEADISVLEAVTLAAWQARIPPVVDDVWGFYQ